MSGFAEEHFDPAFIPFLAANEREGQLWNPVLFTPKLADSIANQFERELEIEEAYLSKFGDTLEPEPRSMAIRKVTFKREWAKKTSRLSVIEALNKAFDAMRFNYPEHELVTYTACPGNLVLLVSLFSKYQPSNEDLTNAREFMLNWGRKHALDIWHRQESDCRCSGCAARREDSD